MKFLLTQRLVYNRKNSIFFLYPNEFSSSFIKLVRKRGLILDIDKEWTGKYFEIKSYQILENDFKTVLSEYKLKIETLRKKFFDRPLLDQLIFILKYIFNRNNKAKEVDKRWARHNAYDDKEEFLELALKIAAQIKDNNFSYGYQTDPGTKLYNYVYYFQIGTKQVSFHSQCLNSLVPAFQGKWIGYRNDRFPFSIVNNRVKNLKQYPPPK